MPLALAAIAALLIITGIKGNYVAVGNQFETDVMGSGSTGGGFISFMLGIVGISAFFRVLGLPKAGEVFLGLLILVYVLQNQNVLTQLQSAIGASASNATTAVGTSATATTSQTVAGTNPVTTPTPVAGTTTPSGQGGIGAA